MSGVVWITGLPASGKTTLGRRIMEALHRRGARAALLDSDVARAAVTPKPTYAEEERMLFYRALAWTASVLAAEGVFAVVAATAHDVRLRDAVRGLAPTMLLVFARCPIELCEARDPKGLYRDARTRERGALPGVHVPFDEPLDADVVVDTSQIVGEAEIDRVVDATLTKVRLVA